jgi:selenocysteine-specific elongation factor
MSTAPQPRHFILGTAGHIDHGKSSLVKALTGIDPDRLPEEQQRGMTIELGFAHLALKDPAGPSREIRFGIVDVPGHERFVRTMVAGATGMDMAMLLVAADDGVMPQTREHVEILQLLGVAKGIVVISKADLVAADRIEQVRADIAAMLDRSPIADWPTLAVSVKSGNGLDELRDVLARTAASLPEKTVNPVFLLAIDRVFAVHGRGTVVTGSVLAGRVAIGQTLSVLPAGLSCKVREVQSHGSAVDRADAGQRAALNLTGIDREQIDRGMELATPGYLTATRYVDAKVRLLDRGERPLRSHSRVRVCIAATEAMATLVVIGKDELMPGAEAFTQLRFTRPIVASHGQRFILRNESAQMTIGGGAVARPVSRRIAPHDVEEFESLSRSASANIDTRLSECIRRAGFDLPSNLRIACEIGCLPEESPALLKSLRAKGELAAITPAIEAHTLTIQAAKTRAMAFLKRHHANHPAEPGLLRDKFVGWIDKRTKPGLGRVFVERLLRDGSIAERGPYVADATYGPTLSPEDADMIERIVSELTSAAFDPPEWPSLKCLTGLSRPRTKALEELLRCDARIVALGPKHFIVAQLIDRLKETVRQLAQSRPFTLAQVRDALQLSRRVVQPLLEYLDRVRFTRRVGDERVLQDGKP